MHFNLPNILTLLRIGFIPVFVLVFFLPWVWSNVICTALFAAAAITDWLDGFLARRWNQTSQFGAFLDPVADKLMVGSALVLLAQTHPTAWFAVAAMIIIGREITISALREWMANIGEQSRVAVSMLGKVKTTVQMVALLLLIYREPIWELDTDLIGSVLLVLAAVLTLWSMILYLRAAWPSLRG